jgi:hypothetical protein
MPYLGGKASDGVYQFIINQIPPHHTYIEPFLGGGAVMQFIRPAAHSIGIELDPNVTRAATAKMAGRPGTRIINDDSLDWLAEWARTGHSFDGSEFIYADPPYLASTRRSQYTIYPHDMTTEEEHNTLIDLLLSIPCKIALSSYFNSLYAQRLKGWRMLTYKARTRGKYTAVECLWLNYPEPWELHDYRYLGKDYRDRERIMKKKRRWTTRLRNMPPSERYALMDALNEVHTGIHAPKKTRGAGKRLPPTPAAARLDEVRSSTTDAADMIKEKI